MQITKLIRKKEDGTFEATLVLSNEQTQFLINFAIGVLIQQGLANIVEEEVEEFPQEETPTEVPPAPELIN